MNAFDLAVSKYPNLYLVSRKLDLATDEQVDELERVWGFVLPNGYREFITIVGECEYCHNLMIVGPASHLKEPDLTIGRITGDYNPWEPADSGLTMGQIMELLSFGSTANGDYVGLHRTQPGMIFFLPEGDNDVIRIDSRQVPFPDFYWHCVGDGLWGEFIRSVVFQSPLCADQSGRNHEFRRQGVYEDTYRSVVQRRPPS